MAYEFQEGVMHKATDFVPAGNNGRIGTDLTVNL
jgi:hypothetical protein